MTERQNASPDLPPPSAHRPARRTGAVALSAGQPLDDAMAAAGTTTITARGRGAMAEKILQLAFDAGVNVRQDPALLDLLDAFDVDSPIPSEALDAVANVLAHVYAQTSGWQPDTPSGQSAAAVSPAQGV